MPAGLRPYCYADLSTLAEPLDVRIGPWSSFEYLFESDTFGRHLTRVPATFRGDFFAFRLAVRKLLDDLNYRQWSSVGSGMLLPHSVSFW